MKQTRRANLRHVITNVFLYVCVCVWYVWVLGNQWATLLCKPASPSLTYLCTWHLVERLVVFEPREAGQRSALHVALHPQRLGHVHRLVVEAAFVPRCLYGCREGRKRPTCTGVISTESTAVLKMHTVFIERSHRTGERAKVKKISLNWTSLLQALTQDYKNVT